ncbi:uncharacterized protein LOC104863178 isoform X2 [Fukomys damarensis]|uniref:uncharacterized protein LOC104863178 isoform X2 n=1 Tax=Fukomys damarensis TaxID=885580 RepID=UPI000540060E|nr:uncharacterized protein LOC104863178 isoform X2 [Fukomys damarensis]XP_010623810.1 uncharacterized protein LOC104863178 isoform X2 [Fukomys damarensis]
MHCLLWSHCALPLSSQPVFAAPSLHVHGPLWAPFLALCVHLTSGRFQTPSLCSSGDRTLIFLRSELSEDGESGDKVGFPLVEESWFPERGMWPCGMKRFASPYPGSTLNVGGPPSEQPKGPVLPALQNFPSKTLVRKEKGHGSLQELRIGRKGIQEIQKNKGMKFSHRRDICCASIGRRYLGRLCRDKDEYDSVLLLRGSWTTEDRCADSNSSHKITDFKN